ncbi:MAG: helix-turn-helix domain-containing protein [Lachnospiraceae bacterium]
MEKNYMHPESIVDFEFLTQQNMTLHSHENPEILFVLEGKLCVKTDRQEYLLSSEDFVLINVNRFHSYTAPKKLLAVRYQISMKKLNEILGQKGVIFWCCSVQEKNRAYGELRRILKDILLCNLNRGTKDKFYINSLYYQLLGNLCSNFLLENNGTDSCQDKDKEKNRMDRVLEYIQLHYQNPISLQDVADELYLSPTYLSKYIRKNSGKGFVELINSVRLSHAMEDLIYTDIPVIRIAMDNGFASVAALNKVFKEIYHMTPSEYRREKRVQPQSSEYMEQAVMYLRNHLKEDDAPEVNNEVYLTLSEEQNQSMTMENVMNIGKASDILNASVQEQIRYCKEHLGIRYVRFWNVFDSDIYLDRIPSDGRINFGRLYEILDFLVEQHLCPYIELRLKHRRLLKTADAILNSWDSKQETSDLAERTALFDAFFGSLIKRYGRSEVSTWIFDYPIENDTNFENHVFNYKMMDDQLWEQYLEEFELIAASLKKRFPEGSIGGAGFPVQHFGQDKLIKLFKHWKMQNYLPDFISITSFPYQIIQENNVWYERKRTDLNYVRDDVETVKSAMDASGFGHLKLHLTECNLTLSDRSYINDSLIRGAFTASTIVQNYDKLGFFGMWNTLDSYSDYADSVHYLFGGSGIFTKTGIPKPAAHVLFFLNRLYRDSVTMKKGCLITSNKHRHYKILVHHLVNMNTAYYLKDEDQLSAFNIEQMLETDEKKVIHVRIEDVPDGCWQIRRYCLNQKSGSVLNEWLNLDIDLELRKAEQNYLKRICTPRLFVQKQYAEQGVLEFDIELEPNEVQYLHITEFN